MVQASWERCLQIGLLKIKEQKSLEQKNNTIVFWHGNWPIHFLNTQNSFYALH